MHTADFSSEIHEKNKRRRQKIFLAGVFLLAFLIFLGGLYFVFYSSFFRVNKIEISGNSEVSDSQIISLLQGEVLSGSFSKKLLGFKNILVWTENIPPAYLLKTFPQLESVSIKKDYGKHSVSVNVKERRKFGIWCAKQTGTDNCWWFDREGIIFKPAVMAQGNLIISVDDYSQTGLGLGSQILPAEFIPNLFSIFGVLQSSGLSVKEIRLNDLSLQEIEVDTYPSTALGASAGANLGPKIYFSLRFPSGDDLAVIQSLVSRGNFYGLSYVDFRTENRAYYK